MGASCGRGSRLVGSVLQDGGDGFVGAGVEQEGARAGGVDTFRPVALDEAENPDGRAEALFWMRPRAQDDVDQRVGVWPDLSGIAPNAFVRPIAITSMGTRHMLGDGGRTMREGAAQMRRHPLPRRKISTVLTVIRASTS